MSERCLEIEPLLSPYVDDELSADERRRVEAHLATCDACRATLAAWREADAALAAVPSRSDVEWERLAQRVETAIDVEEEKERAALRPAMTAAAAMRGATHAEAAAAPAVRRTRSRDWWLWSGSGALVAAALVGLFWPMLAQHPAELPSKLTNGGKSTPRPAEVATPSRSAPSSPAPATISEPPPSTNAPAPYDVRNVRISDLATRPALQHEAPGVIGSLAPAEGKREASVGAPSPGASSGAATAPSEPTTGASSEAASPPVQSAPAQPLPLGREADAKDKAKSTLEVLANEVQGRTKRADEPAPAPGLLRSEASSRALARPAAPSSPADGDASFAALAVRTRAALADGGENALLEAAHDVEAFLTAAPGSPYRAEALESRLRLRTRLVTLDPDLGCDDLRSALSDWRREVTSPSAEMEEVAGVAASHCGS